MSSDLQIYNFFMLIWEIQYEKSIQRIIQIFFLLYNSLKASF